MSGCVNDVISAPHNMDIAIFIDQSGIPCIVISRVFRQILMNIAFIILIQTWQRSWRKREFNGKSTKPPRLDFFTSVIEHTKVIPRNRGSTGSITRWNVA
mmetsp:Transcript_37941/g.70043  ORF Transcript_37941/g.70043 Transcript_37941/m.70043 type:complete len:100 (+) Transcript_37941:497-796(+)